MALDLQVHHSSFIPAFASPTLGPYRRQRITPGPATTASSSSRSSSSKPYQHLRASPMSGRGRDDSPPAAVRLPSISSLLADTHDSDGSGPGPAAPSPRRSQPSAKDQGVEERPSSPSYPRRSPLPSFRERAPSSPSASGRLHGSAAMLPGIRTLPLGPDARQQPQTAHHYPGQHHQPPQLPPPMQRSPNASVAPTTPTAMDSSRLQQTRQECERLLDIFYHLRAENRARRLFSQGDAVPPPHLYEYGDYRAITEYIDVELSLVSAKEGPHVARQVAESYGLQFAYGDERGTAMDGDARSPAGVHQRYPSSTSSGSGHYQYVASPPGGHGYGYAPASSWPPAAGGHHSPLEMPQHESYHYGHPYYPSPPSRDGVVRGAQSSSSSSAAAAATASRRSKAKRRVTKREGEAPACLGCGRLSTAEWRRGPTGPRTLCNACGLLFAKMTRLRKGDGLDGQDPTLDELQAAVGNSSKGGSSTTTSGSSTATTSVSGSGSGSSSLVASRKRSSPPLPLSRLHTAEGSGEYSTSSRSYDSSSGPASSRPTPPTSSNETSPLWSHRVSGSSSGGPLHLPPPRFSVHSAEEAEEQRNATASPAPPYFPRRSTYPPLHEREGQRASPSPAPVSGASGPGQQRPYQHGYQARARQRDDSNPPTTPSGRPSSATALPGISSFGGAGAAAGQPQQERFYPQPPPRPLPSQYSRHPYQHQHQQQHPTSQRLYQHQHLHGGTGSQPYSPDGAAEEEDARMSPPS